MIMDVIFYAVVASATVVLAVQIARLVIRFTERARREAKQIADLASRRPWQSDRDLFTAELIKASAADARRPVHQGQTVYGVMPRGSADFGIDGVVYQQDGSARVLWHDEDWAEEVR